ncbi:MAG: hypothetical protein CMD11_00165 [Flavobacteriales bacterium]|nr:hypothetical protein [Flavobacteriales bacterium]
MFRILRIITYVFLMFTFYSIVNFINIIINDGFSNINYVVFFGLIGFSIGCIFFIRFCNKEISEKDSI